MAGKSRDKFLFNEPKDASERRQYRAKRIKKRGFLKIPVFVYRLSAFLLVLVLALFIWNARDDILSGRTFDWIWGRVAGMGVGDGYPADISGRTVAAGNFKQVNQSIAVLSDTSFTVINSTAKPLVQWQHSYESPALSVADSYYMMYNRGGKAYQIVTESKMQLKSETEYKIFAADIADNGQYILATQARGYSSKLISYLPDGTESSVYEFSDYYVTDVALSPNGRYAATTAVSSKNGAWLSKVSLFDLNKTEAISKFEFTDVTLLSVNYSNNTIIAVGDNLVSVLDSSGKKQNDYLYQSQILLDFAVDNGRTVLLLAPYEGALTSRLVLLDKEGRATFIQDIEQTASSVSLYGDKIALLCGLEVQIFSTTDGSLQGKCSAGSGASSIALMDSSQIYILGRKEIRLASF